MVTWQYNNCSYEHVQVLLARALFCLIYWREDLVSNAAVNIIAHFAGWQSAMWALGSKVVRHIIYATWVLVLYCICYVTTTLLYRMWAIVMEDCRHEFIRLVKELFAVLPDYPTTFDSTLVFPGEGWRSNAGKSKRKSECKGRRDWSKRFPGLRMACWNTRSMTNERFNYCKELGYDVLAVSELWRTQEKFTSRSVEFTTSATARDKHGNLINPNDAAAGVGILLSGRLQDKVLSFGNEGSERICYVRIKGPSCNLFIVAVYIPHDKRVKPSQEDTMAELDAICALAKPSDCLIVLGDFNV